MNIGIISGSGFYELHSLDESGPIHVHTKYGVVDLITGKKYGHTIFFIARHGKGHVRLPNMINYRAHILALRECGVELIIGTSVMGILDESIPMAHLYLFDDLFFIDNRLPSGEVCSIFTEPGEKKRGHYLFATPFSVSAAKIAETVAEKYDIPTITGLVYAHVNGPRFNSKTEITMLRNAGCSTLSQSAGPEIILAGECEIAYLLLGFGIDYANGVKDIPTGIEVLNENMKKSAEIFPQMIFGILDELKNAQIHYFDNGFIYRFE
ncbi:MAG: MTAP family purine nucleoside phosphorylase [bacterium]